MNPFDPGTAEYDAWERRDAESGAALLDDVVSWLGRYLSVPSEHYLTVMALWAAHSHATEYFYVTARLIFDSAEPESGKTRALELLNLLVRAPILTMNTTIAALYRRLVSEPRTILLDETDAIFAKGAAQNHEDLRALLNAGYKRGATVDRCVGDGKNMKVVEFPVYAPAALAGIAGNMPPTITTRAVTLHMRRRAPGEHLDEYIEEDVVEEASKIREPLGSWIRDVGDRLRGARPAMPDGVRDRTAEVWRCLLAVADAAGGDWPERSRTACRYFVLNTDPGELSTGVRLLGDLRNIFGDRDEMPTAEVLERLVALDESPWADMYGKPLDSRRLAKMLGKYGVKPKVIRIGEATARGYTREALADLWRRYLRGNVTSETSVTALARDVTPVTPVADTRPVRVLAAKRNGVIVVPDGATYVGRNMRGCPSIGVPALGNPHVVGGTAKAKCRVPECGGAVHTRAEAIDLYRAHLRQRPDLVDLAREMLPGSDLACWCPPELDCHADLLLVIANEGAEP